ncbi:MBL fold metallo-hydrolase [Rubrolithibacter danxiaensis]|uniref:MBL fold metallo-hydrolase n=1 Tax=Rubrolithibacter danxiaensis TaxID=3390805 RepID=UPI003BF8DDFC
MKIFPLFEGSYSVDSSKKFIPFDPDIHQAKDRPASLFIYVQPFLVKTATDLIVFDTGLGFKNDAGKMVIHENIKKAGFDPEDVNLVLMSHLHFDHSGGMVQESMGKYELSFPNAEYVIQRGEWESAYSKPSKSYRTEIFDVVQRSGHIHFVEGSGNLTEYISYELTGGHCEYHQVFLVKDGEETCFFGGDILPEPEQLLRKFKAKYDFDGAKAMELREEYGIRAAEGNWTCLFYHAKSKAVGKVQFENGAFRIVAV